MGQWGLKAGPADYSVLLLTTMLNGLMAEVGTPLKGFTMFRGREYQQVKACGWEGCLSQNGCFDFFPFNLQREKRAAFHSSLNSTACNSCQVCTLSSFLEAPKPQMLLVLLGGGGGILAFPLSSLTRFHCPCWCLVQLWD